MLNATNAATSDRQGFDRRFYADSSDLQVFRPTSSDDVVTALNYVISNDPTAAGHSVQITSGRHCYEGFVYNSDTKYIIDVTGLRDFGTQQVGGIETVYIGTGYGNWDMYRMFQNIYGKTLPAGSCYSVGMGGHVTGGGYGILSRLHGLAIDCIFGFEIVVDQGDGPFTTQVFANSTAQADQELFWALRGVGGGQIGVITRLFFALDDLPDSPDLMSCTTLSWSWWQDPDLKTTLISEASFAALVQTFWDEFCAQQDPESWKVWAMFHATHCSNDNLVMPLIIYNPYRSTMSTAEFKDYSKSRVRDLVEKFDAIVPLVTDDHPIDGHPYVAKRSSLGIAAPGVDEPVYFYSYLDGTQTLNGSGPNRHGKYKSAYHVDTFTDDMLSAMYQYLTIKDPKTPEGSDLQLSSSLIQMDSYGGKINTVASDATPIPQRSSLCKLQYQTYWQDAGLPPGVIDDDQEEGQLNWINGLYEDVYSETGNIPVLQSNEQYPDATTDGCYFNYPDIYIGSRDTGTPAVSQAWNLYFGENASDLVTIASTWNPKGWFTNSQTFQYD